MAREGTARRWLAEPLLLEFPGLSIDFERRRIVQGEREIRLTPTEYTLLELPARNAGKPVSTDEIISRVWSGAPGTTNDTVRVHMGSLRRKTEPDPVESAVHRHRAVDRLPVHR